MCEKGTTGILNLKKKIKNTSEELRKEFSLVFSKKKFRLYYGLNVFRKSGNVEV